MTDARLPGTWLYAAPWLALSNDARALFAGALMWSAQHETDGFVPRAVLATIPGATEAAALELADHGVWTRTPDGWLVSDWGVSQSTAAYLQRQRARNRDKGRRHRDRQKADANAERNPASNPVSDRFALGRQAGRKEPTDSSDSGSGSERQQGQEELHARANEPSGEVPARHVTDHVTASEWRNER